MQTKRTDLAVEIRESFPEDDVELKGVILKEKQVKDTDIHISTVQITNQRGAKAMGKPKGHYITVESENLEYMKKEHREILVQTISRYLKLLAHREQVGDEGGVLVVGLGNREATPDSVGPRVVDQLVITRHLRSEYGENFSKEYSLKTLAAIAPGVTGQTGMEVVEILKGIVSQMKPDLIVVVDALAARSVERLNRTIQITDTGICPGSGVGNHRKALNKETLGVPVVAVGVPTVVDAATIVSDYLEEAFLEEGLSEEELQNFFDQIWESRKRSGKTDLIVTPKNMDEAVQNIADVLSDAINDSFAFLEES